MATHALRRGALAAHGPAGFDCPPDRTKAHGHRPQELLHWLVRFSRAEGDFDWGLAYHPYPQSLLEPATWRDTDAHMSMDTPFITFRNIEVLAAWARDKSTWFRGERPRAIHLTEQGFNSPDYSKATLQQQAAALAYSWVKIRDLPPALQEMMIGMQVGQATRPFGSIEEGVRVLVLCGRDEVDASAPSFDQVYAQLNEERVNLRSRRYLRDLRRDAVIDFR